MTGAAVSPGPHCAHNQNLHHTVGHDPVCFATRPPAIHLKGVEGVR